jgi:site-specific recombinase XerD
VFEVLYSTGLRRAELRALDMTDCDRSAETIRVNCGKGGKDRLVPVGRMALEAVDAYLGLARPLMRPHDRSLFVGAGGKRLKPNALNAIFSTRSDEAQPLPRITPHLMRHAFASHLLDNGASIRHVQAMLGHALIETTAMYTHVTAKGLREALARANPREAMERGTLRTEGHP